MPKKKLERSPLKQKFDLRELVDKINSKFGEGTIVLASEAVNMSVEFTSSGCYAFDFATGGGIPQNRITQLVGGFSSGKTTLVLKSIAEFQKKYQEDGYAFFIDVENALDLKYAQRLGVQLDRMFVIRPDSGEQAVDALMEMLKQDIPLFGVVDSIPAIVPFAELESSLDTNFVGNHPRLINRMVKLTNARLKRSLVDENASPTTVVLINQIREKIGVMFGSPDTTPGGRGKDFFSALTVNLRGGDKIHEEFKKGGISRKILVGRTFHATVAKNKVGGRPYEEAEYTYYTKTFGENVFGTYDNESILLEFGLFHEIIQLIEGKKNTKMVYKCKLGLIEYAQKHAFIQALRQKPKIARSLYRAIMKKIEEENSADSAGLTVPANDAEETAESDNATEE